MELNGEVVGQIKEYDNETGIIYWDIPYKKGKLEVIGMDKENREVIPYAITSSGRPHALSIQAVEETINKDTGLAQMIIQVVDEYGVPLMLSDDEITCQIADPGRLLGLAVIIQI